MSILFLAEHPDGSLTGPVGSNASTLNWTLVDYTEQPCDDDCECPCHQLDAEPMDCGCVSPFDCFECDEPIYGQHYTCLDNGADNVHVECACVVPVKS
jgi:hypothetical protein